MISKSKNILVALLFIASIFISAGAASAANYCNGGFPHSFYGNIDIDNSDAPAGTLIRAKIVGEVRNNYTTTVSGAYGNAETQDKFGVVGKNEGYDPNVYEIPPNVTFEILVNNVWTPAILNNSLNAIPFECSEVSNVNLNANSPECPDSDGDSVCDDDDICDGFDDNLDSDNDGIPNGCDSCPNDASNDIDNDGVCGAVDNCPGASNSNQADSDNDGLGNACDACANDADNDADQDGVCGNVDNCPANSNSNQADSDNDGIGNSCDACPLDDENDADGDGVCGDVDNCPTNSNSNQADVDEDGLGNACDDCTDVDFDLFCLENNEDCDDTDETVNPDADEVVDGVDNDCDGQIDENSNSVDDDGDFFSENEGDCDDSNPNIFPEAFELCDNLDNDCNEVTEDGSQEENYGQVTDCSIGVCQAQGVMDCVNGQMVDTCEPPETSEETCDEEDNDCDGQIDENLQLTFYRDSDSDLFGNLNVFQNACAQPQGYVNDNTDCDDTNENVFPNAVEVCDQLDNDCDGEIDEGGVCNEACPDADNDQICDNEDECPTDPNNDEDQDTVCGNVDNCPQVSNANQLNSDDDGLGDACDPDDDNDGVNDEQDNCQAASNANQLNTDNDSLGNACDPDDDNDSVADGDDNCQTVENTDQTDSDGDGLGNVCDFCPNDDENDADFDTVCGDVDNCPNVPNLNQEDMDEDGIGTACDEEENTYEVTLTIYGGWTLFALPYKPLGIDNSEEIDNAISDAGAGCDVIMRFDGATQEMKDDILGFPDQSFNLVGTEGYFIHCENPIEFEYEGTLWV